MSVHIRIRLLIIGQHLKRATAHRDLLSRIFKCHEQRKKEILLGSINVRGSLYSCTDIIVATKKTPVICLRQVT